MVYFYKEILVKVEEDDRGCIKRDRDERWFILKKRFQLNERGMIEGLLSQRGFN
jgi:hypothetical protein